jgi:hypothetical protein
MERKHLGTQQMKLNWYLCMTTKITWRRCRLWSERPSTPAVAPDLLMMQRGQQWQHLVQPRHLINPSAVFFFHRTLWCGFCTSPSPSTSCLWHLPPSLPPDWTPQHLQKCIYMIRWEKKVQMPSTFWKKIY